MRVRRAEIDDLGAIVEIYNHAIATSVATFDVDRVTVDERRAWFRRFDDENPIWVAAIDGAVVGYAYYLPYRPRPGYRTTKECSVYVAADRQGSGIGSALYLELIAHARRSGVHALLAVLGGENPASVALHTKHGFALVGRLREVGRKLDQWVDTPIYELLL
jgi:phosphinothricin acetyltransferase